MKQLVLHPFFFGLFPILFLFSYNFGHVSADQLIVPLYLVTLITLGAWLVLQLLYKNKFKSGLGVSLFLFLFFSYGHMFSALPTEPISLRRHALLLGIWLFLFLAGTLYLKRTTRDLSQVNRGLNLAGAALVAFPFLTGALYPITSTPFEQEAHAALLPRIETDGLPLPERFPDIYYILLDAYAREDTLKEIHGYNNSEFLNFLKEKGFYVAGKSRANYNQTWLALASALNLTYINDMAGQNGMEGNNRTPLKNMIQNNHVVSFLKDFGYKFVSFESGQSFSNMKAADIHLPDRQAPDEFQVTLLDTTPLPGLFYEVGRLFGSPHTAYQAHRDRINYALDHLADLAGVESPIFVFAHILAPHPPFVFGPNGEAIEPNRRYWIGDGTAFISKGGTVREYLQNYKGEVEYLNQRLKVVIENILAKSPEPPIIIIQSDHGSRIQLDWENPDNTNFQEAFSILSAFYVPDTSTQGVYEGISPVNTFRVLFNTYFGTQYEILPDRSYYSTWDELYEFLEVTSQVT